MHVTAHHIHFSGKARLLHSAESALLLCVMLLGFSAPAWAEETIQTLSGTIDAVTLDASVSTVILNGVTVADDGGITIEAPEATLVVMDGTTNTTGLIQTSNVLTVTGSGDLHAGSLYAGAGITLNYTGTLTIDDGVIFTSTGDLVINSGTYNITGKDAAHYAIGSLAGDIYLNGGTFTLFGSLHAIHSTTGAVVLAGGTLDASSDYVAVTAGNRLSNGVIIGPTMEIADGMIASDVNTTDDSIVSCLVSTDGTPAASVKGEGPAVAQGTVSTEGATQLSAEEAKAASSANASAHGSVSSGRIALVVLVCAIVIVAIVAGCMAARKCGKKNNAKHANG